jgi:hypothetical protein
MHDGIIYLNLVEKNVGMPSSNPGQNPGRFKMMYMYKYSIGETFFIPCLAH